MTGQNCSCICKPSSPQQRTIILALEVKYNVSYPPLVLTGLDQWILTLRVSEFPVCGLTQKLGKLCVISFLYYVYSLLPCTTSLQPLYISACVRDYPIIVEDFKYCEGPPNHRPAREKRALTTRSSACKCVMYLTTQTNKLKMNLIDYNNTKIIRFACFVYKQL